jgi:hypothetical protein
MLSSIRILLIMKTAFWVCRLMARYIVLLEIGFAAGSTSFDAGDRALFNHLRVKERL